MQKAGNRENPLQLWILHIFQGLFYIPGNSTCPYSTIIEELSVRAIEAVADKDICCVAQSAVSILPMFSDFVRSGSRSNVTQTQRKHSSSRGCQAKMPPTHLILAMETAREKTLKIFHQQRLVCFWCILVDSI